MPSPIPCCGADSDSQSLPEQVEEHLKANRGLYGQVWTEPEVGIINDKLAGLITTKPVVYLVNISKKDILRKKNKWLPKVIQN